MAKKLHLVHVKSHVLDKAPSAETINYGEIAVNYNHQSPGLYIRDDQDNVVKFIAEPYFEKIVGTGVTENDGETFTPLSEIIQQDEETVSAALNDLEDRKADKDYVDAAVSSITIDVDSEIDSASTNPVENRAIYDALQNLEFDTDDELISGSTNPVQGGAVYKAIVEDELAIAAAMNDINDRKADKTYVDEAISASTIEVDAELTSAGTNPVEGRAIWQVISDDEETIAAAINDLEENKADKAYVDSAVSSITIDVDTQLDSASTNPVQNKVLWKVIADDEKVTSAALNDLQDRKADKTYVDDAIENITIDVDDQLDSASTNPVENRVVYNALEEKADADYVENAVEDVIDYVDEVSAITETIAVTGVTIAGAGNAVGDVSFNGKHLTLTKAIIGDGGSFQETVSGVTIDGSGNTVIDAEFTDRNLTLTLGDTCQGNAKIFYGTCATAAGTSAKTVTCQSFSAGDLVKGALIFVTFSNTNSAAVANLRLDVNGTGAKPIKKIFTNTSPASLTNAGELRANQTYLFTYDSANWVCMTLDYNTNTTYSAISQANIESTGGTTAGLITGQRFTQGLAKRTDKTLSTTSANPIANSAITTNLYEHTGTTIDDTGYTSSQMHLPAVTADDNGKILRVVNGEWVLVVPSTVYSGQGAPAQNLGIDGDIYLQTS